MRTANAALGWLVATSGVNPGAPNAAYRRWSRPPALSVAV